MSRLISTRRNSKISKFDVMDSSRDGFRALRGELSRIDFVALRAGPAWVVGRPGERSHQATVDLNDTWKEFVEASRRTSRMAADKVPGGLAGR
jgi:hypothetical protein